MKVKVGGVLKGFNVHHLDGSVTRYDKEIHNYMSQEQFAQQSSFLNADGAMSRGYLGLCETRSSYLLSGIGGGAIVWNKANKQLSNIDVFNNFTGSEQIIGTYVLSTGEFAFRRGDLESAGAGFVNLSNDSFGDSITGKRIYQFHRTTVTDMNTIGINSPELVSSYSNGKITRVNQFTQTVTLTANRTIRSLRFSSATNNSSDRTSSFDFETPLVMLTGQSISVDPGDFVITFTFNTYEPVVFDSVNCPIQGISASGRFQRLLPILYNNSIDTSDAILSSSNTRMFLLSDTDDLVTIGDFSSTLLTGASTSTSTELITPEIIVTTALNSNDYTYTFKAYGEVLTGGLVKQIVIGRNDGGNPLGYVIEFDTPQNIPVGKVLYFKTQLQIVPDIVVPTFLSNA